MNTLFNRLSFLLPIMIVVIGLTSCETEEVAHATITVKQEFTASQGPTLQYRAVEGAEVRIYGPTGSEHIEVRYLTNSQGQVEYSYEYRALLNVDVTYEGSVYSERGLAMELGESTNFEIIIPE